MIAGSLESVLVSRPFDGVGGSIEGVRVRTIVNGTSFFGLITNLLLDSVDGDGDTIIRLETKVSNEKFELNMNNYLQCFSLILMSIIKKEMVPTCKRISVVLCRDFGFVSR